MRYKNCEECKCATCRHKECAAENCKGCILSNTDGYPTILCARHNTPEMLVVECACCGLNLPFGTVTCPRCLISQVHTK